MLAVPHQAALSRCCCHFLSGMKRQRRRKHERACPVVGTRAEAQGAAAELYGRHWRVGGTGIPWWLEPRINGTSAFIRTSNARYLPAPSTRVLKSRQALWTALLIVC